MNKIMTCAVMLVHLTVVILQPIQAQQLYQQVYQQPFEKPKVAVYVSGHSGYSYEEISAIRTATLNALVRSGEYQVIERSNVIEAELAKQAGGAVDDDQLTAFGRQLGSQYVCITDMTFLRNRRANSRNYRDYQVSVRMIDVETAEVVGFKGTDVDIQDGRALAEAIAYVVDGMLKTVQSVKAANIPKMAVYITGGRAGQREGNALYSYMVGALFSRSKKLGTFKVVERSDAFTRQIDREQTIMRSGRVDDGQIARLGKQYGIERILVADMAYAMNTYNISARIINVETASVEKASQLASTNSDLNGLRQISFGMVEEMTPQYQSASPQLLGMPKVAVYVSEHGGYSYEEKSAIRAATINALVRIGRYQVIERSNVIETELSKQAGGAVDDDQLTVFGKQLGAQYVCITDMTFLRNSRSGDRNRRIYQVSVRLIDVETAEVLSFYGMDADIQDGPSLTTAVGVAVNGMWTKTEPVKAADLPKMAVYVIGGKAGQREGNALYSYVLGALFSRSKNLGTFKVVERSDAFTRQIDREQAVMRSGHVDNGQIARLGKQYGIERILVADMTYAMNTYNISGRIINVETAGVEKATQMVSIDSNLDKLGQISFNMVEEMMGLTNEEIVMREAAAREQMEKNEKLRRERGKAIKKENTKSRISWILGLAIILGLVVSGYVLDGKN